MRRFIRSMTLGAYRPRENKWDIIPLFLIWSFIGITTAETYRLVYRYGPDWVTAYALDIVHHKDEDQVSDQDRAVVRFVYERFFDGLHRSDWTWQNRKTALAEWLEPRADQRDIDGYVDVEPPEGLEGLIRTFRGSSRPSR